MSLIATLDIALRADTGQLDKSLQKTEGTVQRFTVSINKAGSGVEQSMGDMSTKSAAMAGMVAGVYAAIAAAAINAGKKLYDMASQGMSGLAQLGKSAQMLGITTTALAGLERGAALSGISMEELTGHLTKFQKHVSEGAMGEGEALAAFNQLGIRLEQIKDLPLLTGAQ